FLVTLSPCPFSASSPHRPPCHLVTLPSCEAGQPLSFLSGICCGFWSVLAERMRVLSAPRRGLSRLGYRLRSSEEGIRHGHCQGRSLPTAVCVRAVLCGMPDGLVAPKHAAEAHHHSTDDAQHHEPGLR